MQKKKAFGKLAAILYCFISLTQSVTARPPLYLNHCQLEASSTHGEVQIKECGLSRTNNSGPGISVSNLVASWSVIDNDSKNLLLSLTFSTKGSGTLKVNLMSSPRYMYPFFCGKITNTNNSNTLEVMHAWIRCEQQYMRLEDKMNLFIDEDTNDRRRSTPQRIQVDLPGCTLPQFMNSDLCKEKEEQRIRFHVRRHKQTIRVVLSRSVYKSRFEGEKRARARRYKVALHEEPPADAWLGVGGGDILQMKELSYPKRYVRFRSLQLKKTYIVSVWKNGEVKRYAKKITLC